MDIAQKMLTTFNDDPNLFKKVVTDDESWVHSYDIETKAQSSQLQRPRSKKARDVHSNVKVLLSVFCDCNGVVHHEFLRQGRKVNKEYYLEVMRQLREAIRQKRTELWKNQSWILHHDNASVHTSMLVHEFLVKSKTIIMAQTPYSPDLALVFPKLKTPMKGKWFATIAKKKKNQNRSCWR